MKQRVIWSVVFVLLAAAMGPALLAQDADNNIAKIYVAHVKSGMESLFEGGFKAHLEWRKQQGDPFCGQEATGSFAHSRPVGGIPYSILNS